MTLTKKEAAYVLADLRDSGNFDRATEEALRLAIKVLRGEERDDPILRLWDAEDERERR